MSLNNYFILISELTTSL